MKSIQDAMQGAMAQAKAGQENPSSSVSAGSTDSIPPQAIRFWEHMTEMYGHRWTTAHGETPQRGLWLTAISKLSVAELKAGIAACVKRGDAWPPSLPEFMKLCRPDKRENAAMYSTNVAGYLEKQLSAEERETGRSAIARMREGLR